MTETAPEAANEKVGFRDIYRAVGESESRIKEHISLVLFPLTQAVADHEVRLRNIEENGSDEAREALAGLSTLTGRVSNVEAWQANVTSAGLERRRLGVVTNRALFVFMAVCTFFITSFIAVANYMTAHP